MSRQRPVLEEPGQGHQGIRRQRVEERVQVTRGSPDSKSRKDLVAGGVEVELDARPSGPLLCFF